MVGVCAQEKDGIQPKGTYLQVVRWQLWLYSILLIDLLLTRLVISRSLFSRVSDRLVKVLRYLCFGQFIYLD